MSRMTAAITAGASDPARCIRTSTGWLDPSRRRCTVSNCTRSTSPLRRGSTTAANEPGSISGSRSVAVMRSSSSSG